MFLLQLSGNASGNAPATANSTTTQLRVGYFGYCAGAPTDLTCVGSSNTSLNETLLPANGTSIGTTKALPGRAHLALASTLRSNIMFCLITVAGILFTIGLILLSVVKCYERKAHQRARTTKILTWTTLSLLWLASLLTLIATVSVAQTTGALAYLSKQKSSRTTIEQGTTLQALQWILTILALAFTAGTTFLLLRRRQSSSYLTSHGTSSLTELAPAQRSWTINDHKAPYPSTTWDALDSQKSVGFSAPPKNTHYNSRGAVPMPSEANTNSTMNENRWHPQGRAGGRQPHRTSLISILWR